MPTEDETINALIKVRDMLDAAEVPTDNRMVWPMATYLTEHFTLEEMVHSDTANACGIDNTPPPEIVTNLTRLCEVLEKIRDLCGGYPVTVNSGYRCEALNEQVGGVEDSAHRYGLGADIVIPEYGDPTMICENIEPYLAELEIDQLIDETGGGARWSMSG
jgi:zinc D-Ala-D-Ala carboxypeptidase